MMKLQWLKQIEAELDGKLTKNDIYDIMRDYAEYFEEGKRQGKTEDEISEELGPPVVVALSIIAENQASTIQQQPTVKKVVKSSWALRGLSLIGFLLLLPFLLLLIFGILLSAACVFAVGFASISAIALAVISLSSFPLTLVALVIFIGVGGLGVSVFLLTIVYFLLKNLMKWIGKRIENIARGSRKVIEFEDAEQF